MKNTIPKKIPVLFSRPQKIPASFIDPKKSLLAKMSDPKKSFKISLKSSWVGCLGWKPARSQRSYQMFHWPGLIHYHKALVETRLVSKIVPNVSFFLSKMFAHFLESSLKWGSNVEMLNFKYLMYDILSENHNISWTKWYKDLVKLKEKDTVQHCWILLIE